MVRVDFVRVVADDMPVRPVLMALDRPLVHFVAGRCLAEENASIGRDVEIISETQTGVVVDRPWRTVVSSVTTRTSRSGVTM